MHRAISADKSPFCTQTILLLSNGYTRIVVMIVVCLTIALSFMNVILVTSDLTSNVLTSFQLFLMILPHLEAVPVHLRSLWKGNQKHCLPMPYLQTLGSQKMY
jgi:hypothetical protein